MVIPIRYSSECPQSMSRSVRQVAENPSTPAQALHKLAKSLDVGVRTAIADHINTSIETIMFLTQDASADLRYALAENHNIDSSALHLLTEDTNPYVAQRALKTLARLAGGTVISGMFARMNAAQNLRLYRT